MRETDDSQKMVVSFQIKGHDLQGVYEIKNVNKETKREVVLFILEKKSDLEGVKILVDSCELAKLA